MSSKKPVRPWPDRPEWVLRALYNNQGMGLPAAFQEIMGKWTSRKRRKRKTEMETRGAGYGNGNKESSAHACSQLPSCTDLTCDSAIVHVIIEVTFLFLLLFCLVHGYLGRFLCVAKSVSLATHWQYKE